MASPCLSACLTPVPVMFKQSKKEIFSAAEGDKTIKVFDSRNGQLIRVLQGHKGMVTSLYYSSTVQLLFSGSIDSTVGIWTEKGELGIMPI